jgi:hypothetical protein
MRFFEDACCAIYVDRKKWTAKVYFFRETRTPSAKTAILSLLVINRPGYLSKQTDLELITYLLIAIQYDPNPVGQLKPTPAGGLTF